MTVYITEAQDFSKRVIEEFTKRNFKVYKSYSKDLDEGYLSDAQIIYIRLANKWDQNLLKKAPNLKYICTPTTGLDHIDLDYCNNHNIQVLSLKGETDFLGSIPSTAEHTWALLMASLRKIPQASKHVADLQWDRDLFKSHNLFGKNLGVLGLGRVGKQVAKFGLAFGMSVSAYDVDKTQKLDRVDSKIDLDVFLKELDFLCIHIPLDSTTEHFIDDNFINKLPKKVTLINTSRGKVWDEESIVKALINNKIRAVATDVIEFEQHDNKFESPLIKNLEQLYDKVIITPHIAGATYDSMAMTEEFIFNKLMSTDSE